MNNVCTELLGHVAAFSCICWSCCYCIGPIWWLNTINSCLCYQNAIYFHERKHPWKINFHFCVKSGPPTPAKACWALSCSGFLCSFFSFPLTFNLCKGLSAFVWKGKSSNCFDAEIVPGSLGCLYSNGYNGAAQQSSEKIVRIHDLPCDLRATATDWQHSDLYYLHKGQKKTKL